MAKYEGYITVYLGDKKKLLQDMGKKIYAEPGAIARNILLEFLGFESDPYVLERAQKYIEKLIEKIEKRRKDETDS